MLLGLLHQKTGILIKLTHKQEEIKEDLFKSILFMLKTPSHRMWIDYDEDADVLYISFKKPQHANDSVMEDNLVYHYHDKEMVGVTVIGAKKYGV